MAWNRSSNDGRAVSPKPPRRGCRPRPTVRGAIAGAIIVLVAVIAAWWLWPTEEHSEAIASMKKPSRIREVMPAAAPKAAEKKPLTKEEKRAKEIKFFRDKYGTNMPPAIRTHIYYLENPPKRSFQVETPHSYLKHPSERQIASLVLVEPGTEFFDQPTYDERFNKDFLDAFVDRIEISEDDSEEVVANKKEIEAIKREIAKTCRETGKKPNEIMNEHAAVMFELGKFQSQMAEELRAIRNNPEYSDADVEDFFKAMNVMREQRGLNQLKIPDLTKRSIMLDRLRSKSEFKQSKERK